MLPNMHRLANYRGLFEVVGQLKEVVCDTHLLFLKKSNRKKL